MKPPRTLCAILAPIAMAVSLHGAAAIARASDCNSNGVQDSCEAVTRNIELFAAQLLASPPDPLLACMFELSGDGSFNGGDIQFFVANFFAPLGGGLFTQNADVVDFNSVTAGGGCGGGSLYDALGGDDFVVLPLNATEAAEAGYDTAQTFHGGSGGDTIAGGTLNDSIDGGPDNDSLSGGPGDDTYYVDAAGDTVNEQPGEGVDTVVASISYTINAQPNIENVTLSGSADINAIGNTSNNVLTGNGGNNTLDGGSGNDTASFALSLGPITLNLINGVPQNTGGAGMDNLISIENLIGSSFSDTLNGNAVNNIIDGGPGNDTLTGGAGIDMLLGNQDDDTLNYDAADSLLDGGPGDDGVRAPGAGSFLNTSAFANIEIIDLTGTGNNTVGLNPTSVVNMSTTTDTVRVNGNSGDVVNLTGGGWSTMGTVMIDSITYNKYVNGAATVLAQCGVTVNPS